MPLTADERRNERLKLTANWANTLAAAIITVGTFVPIAQYIYGILPQNIDIDLVYGSAIVCFGSGWVIHLIGQWILGGLR